MADILRKTYRIARWARWDDKIDAAVRAFRARFVLTPNILLAGEATLARIDMAAAKANISNTDGEPAQEGEHTPIGLLQGSRLRARVLRR